MALTSGTRLGVYDITAQIGVGGMGEVYQATDTNLKRRVAIKVLPAGVARDADRLARFQREAEVLAVLNHPNIAAIYGLEKTPDFTALVMELVEGDDLAQRIARGPIALDEALPIAKQIAEALEAAHEQGIIHRDLKPANIKVRAAGTVKVLDFGLAKAMNPAGASSRDTMDSPTLSVHATMQGVILGTAAYMAPEQARGKTVDRRADIWAFGVVLYEMLSGRRAFEGDDISITLASVLKDDVHWEALPPDLPAPMRRLLRRCLEKDPKRRLSAMADARLELDETAEVTKWDVASSLIAPKPGTAKRFRVLAAAGMAGTLLLGAATGVLLLRGTRSPVPGFRPVTFGNGHITGARFAADGRSVVYGASWVGQTPQLYATLPGNPASRSLGLSNAGIWSISSSGEMAIAYPCTLNWGECMGTLALVPSAGGTPREILDNVHDADWAPDGKTLIVAQFGGEKDRIFQYPSGNVLYETRGWVRHVRASPKGDRVAFFDHTILGDIGGSVCVLDLAGNKKVLSSEWKGLQGLAWSASGDEVWFTGSRVGKGDALNLFAVTLSGSERAILSMPGALWITDISRDGRRALLMHGRPRGVMIGQGPGASGERDLSWLDYSTAADLSSDGKTLLFYEWGGGVGGDLTVYLRGMDGSEGKRLGEGKPLALSPDGQWALTLQKTVPPQLVLLPTGLGKRKPLPRGTISEFLDWAAWSADGGRIFFTAAEAGHRPRTYVQDIDKGPPQPVTPEGMAGTLLSPDGKLIAAVDRYRQYYLCPIDGGEPSPLEGYDDGDVLLQWGKDGRSLFLRGPEDKELKIYKLDLQTGTKTLWKELMPPYAAGLLGIGADPGQVRITPDGASYVYTFWVLPGGLYLAEGLK